MWRSGLHRAHQSPTCWKSNALCLSLAIPFLRLPVIHGIEDLRKLPKTHRSLSWTVIVTYKFSTLLVCFGFFCQSLHQSFFATSACGTDCFTRPSWINQQNIELPERAQYFVGEDFTGVLHITHPLSQSVMEMLFKICFQHCVTDFHSLFPPNWQKSTQLFFYSYTVCSCPKSSTIASHLRNA